MAISNIQSSSLFLFVRSITFAFAIWCWSASSLVERPDRPRGHQEKLFHWLGCFWKFHQNVALLHNFGPQRISMTFKKPPQFLVLFLSSFSVRPTRYLLDDCPWQSGLGMAWNKMAANVEAEINDMMIKNLREKYWLRWCILFKNCKGKKLNGDTWN